MTYRALAVKLREGGGWGVALLGLAIPLSTGADNTLLALVALAWLVALPEDWRESWLRFTSTPPMLAGAAFFGALVVGMLYSPVPLNAAWSSSATKYSELLLMPALAWAAAEERTRRRAVSGVIAPTIGPCVSRDGS